MNAIHVIDSLAIGGAERVAVELANALHAQGLHTTVCATRTSGPLASEIATGVQLAVLNRRRRWDGINRLADLIRSSQADVVHSHGRSSMRLVAFTRWVHRLAVPHVFHDHSSVGADANPRRVTEVLPVRLAVDAFIGVDHRLLARMSGLLPPERIQLVRNSVDTRRFDVAPLDVRTTFGLQGADLVTAVVANLQHPKDHRTFLEAFSRVQTSRVAALLVGDVTFDPVYASDVRRMVDNADLSEQVRFTGARADVPPILLGCDLAVFASRRETGPLAVLEYLAARLPTATTATGELVEALAPYEVLRIAPAGDARALADALAALVALPEPERRELGDRGRKVVEENFSPTAAARQVLEVYEGLLGQHRPHWAR